MRFAFPSTIVAVIALALALSRGAAFAQAQPAPGAQDAQQAVKQIALTDKQIQSLIAAQKEMDAIIDKLPPAQQDNPDAKVQAQIEAVAKKDGFASYDEYGDVAANVSLVLSGIDPKTKAFTQPPEVLKKQIADMTADKKIPEKDKKEALAEMNEALKYTTNVQFPANIALVTKYYDQLSAVMKEDE
ncbi:MAG: hypothetical protein EKK40_10385 [Bradyrhizobiaceae bacterium]|nr:MAG: hypothetical protein EKK40_10385 [Bradyrhizobiaceae bacterium]